MIPVINVALMRAKNQWRGELAFSFDADPALLDLPFVSFASPVDAAVRYDIAEDGTVAVEGEISFTLAGSCSRCLSDAEERVTYPLEAVFVPHAPDEDKGELGYRGGCVNLEELMRESVLFALPNVLHCTACRQQDQT